MCIIIEEKNNLKNKPIVFYCIICLLSSRNIFVLYALYLNKNKQ